MELFLAPATAPSRLRVIDITEDSFTLEWSAPARDGGSRITGYVIEKRESTSLTWSRVTSCGAKMTSCVVKHVTKTCSYFVRVAAENEEGLGDWLELSDPIRPCRPTQPPSEPLALGVEPISKTSVTLRWMVPAETGGVPLSGYVVEMQEGSTGRWKTVGHTEAYR